VIVAVQIEDEDLMGRVDELARQHGVTRDALVEQLLAAGLEEEEEHVDRTRAVIGALILGFVALVVIVSGTLVVLAVDRASGGELR